MAPEVLRHEYYNSNADIWSLGVLLYEMLHGYAPFKGNIARDTVVKILGNAIKFGDFIKEDGKEVIKVILNLDCEERPRVCEILDSHWARRMEEEQKPIEIE
jgi:serine/threonine protein kinase